MGAFGKMSGIDCRRFVRLHHPFPLALNFSHSPAVSLPCVHFWKRLLRRLFQTRAEFLILSESPVLPFTGDLKQIQSTTFLNVFLFITMEKRH